MTEKLNHARVPRRFYILTLDVYKRQQIQLVLRCVHPQMDIIGGFVANAVAVKIDVDAARIAGVRTIGHLKAIGHQAAAIVGGQLVHVIKHLSLIHI